MMNKISKEKAISPISGAKLPLPGPGRPKGSKNKLSRLAKDTISEVYERLGGIEAHIAFLKSNKRALERFYNDVYPKLMRLKPEIEMDNKEISGEINAKVKLSFEYDLGNEENGE